MKTTYVVFKDRKWIAYLHGAMGECPLYIGDSEKHARQAAKDRSKTV